MHVCKYKGTDHLCFFQGHQQKGYCRGHGVILDNQYRIVKSVQGGGGMSTGDMHEFMLINDGKSALMTIYQQRQFDMTSWNIRTGVGWVMESIFQEVDVETSNVLFEWRSLDHVDPSLSYTFPRHTDTSGTGLEPRSPWDYFHINSIDKNSNGDYLISSRHTSCVYKISGVNGSVIWRLNGPQPSFKNLNFGFSQQHDARWLSENTTHTVLSLYNNGYNGFNRTNEYSSGMVILIDHVNMTASQVQEFAPPGKNMVSSSQGNMQTLSNGSVVIGWGNNAYVSEHDADGEALFWGHFADSYIMNYRAQKFQWEGNPTDVPAIWTYAKFGESSFPMTFYVSWNGATRVRSWKFYGSSNRTGPYTFLANVPRSGFETVYTHPNSYLWTYAVAISAEGKALGQSRHQFTFTPSPELAQFCANDSCANTKSYGDPNDLGARPIYPPSGVKTVPWVDSEQGVFVPPPAPMTIVEKVAIIVGFITVLGAVLVIRYRRKRASRRDRNNDDLSQETMMNDREQKSTRGRVIGPMRAWWKWNWRRWVNGEREYFPLGRVD